MAILSPAEEMRYNRQINLRAIDFDGQEKLKSSKILIVGLGGLGCAASQYLTTAGIGHLTLLDFDTVSLSNLQRQVLHQDSRLGMAKVLSAKQSLEKLNPHIEIKPIHQKLNDDELMALIKNVDLVLDCTDNLSTRNQLDKCCQQIKKPLISGAVIRMEGLLTTFTYEENTPTYRGMSQLFGEQGQSCAETGVLAPMVGIIGTMQALEAIKVRLNIGENLCGRLLMVDGLTMQFREMILPTF